MSPFQIENSKKRRHIAVRRLLSTTSKRPQAEVRAPKSSCRPGKDCLNCHKSLRAQDAIFLLENNNSAGFGCDTPVLAIFTPFVSTTTSAATTVLSTAYQLKPTDQVLRSNTGRNFLEEEEQLAPASSFFVFIFGLHQGHRQGRRRPTGTIKIPYPIERLSRQERAKYRRDKNKANLASKWKPR